MEYEKIPKSQRLTEDMDIRKNYSSFPNSFSHKLFSALSEAPGVTRIEKTPVLKTRPPLAESENYVRPINRFAADPLERS